MSRENLNPTLGVVQQVLSPPPPPAMPSETSPGQKRSSEMHEICFQKISSNETKIYEDLLQFAKNLGSKFDEKLTPPGASGCSEQMRMFAVCTNIDPILQRGPVCGIVALSMAASQLQGSSLNPDDILRKAVARKYTKKGEIFSAEAMLDLTREVYPTCKARIVDIDEGSAEVLSSALLEGNIIIFPYDADFNHSPALRKGHAAHWAIIHGLAIVMPEEEFRALPQAAENSVAVIIHPETLTFETKTTLQKEFRTKSQVFVVAHHGKSAHTAIWNIQDCIASNLNLKEISPKILADPESMVLSDIKEKLRGKVILIQHCSINAV